MHSIEAYMAEMLFSPGKGFYETQNIADHFVTPSTLNSSYHHYIKQWFLRLNLQDIYEIGAGTGALASVLAPDFSNYTICEKSAYQRSLQKKQLALSPHVQWVDRINSCQSGMIVMQEVLDCLPAKMFAYENGKVYEWHVQDNRLIYQYITHVLSPILQDYLNDLLEYYNVTHFSFVDPTPTQIFLSDLYNKMAPHMSVLIIDYGFVWPHGLGVDCVTCPLRGYYQQTLIAQPWEHNAVMDLTYHVDFSQSAKHWEDLGGQVQWTLPFAQFLTDILQWSCIDVASQDRMLFDPRFMGKSFTAMLLTK